MSDKLVVTSTPHVRDNITTSNIMRDVIIALIPTTIMGIYFFGIDALITVAVSVISAVFFEYAVQKFMKRDISIGDYSAALTGLLLALNLPASKNIAVPIIGSFIAIVLIKQLFGGIGFNFINPALGARVFLLLSYPTAMLNYNEPLRNFFGIGRAVDAFTSATQIDAVSSQTPLALLKTGYLPLADDYINALIGYTKGTIGEVCAIALILGGIYLIFRKVINWRIPIFYILTVMVMSFIIGRNGMFTGSPVFEVLSGGLLLGAIFMATDYTTSPVTNKGKIIMGIGAGIITMLIRKAGSYPEGVSFGILIMNLAVPLIEKFTKPRVFGKNKK